MNIQRKIERNKLNDWKKQHRKNANFSNLWKSYNAIKNKRKGGNTDESNYRSIRNYRNKID